MARRLSAVVVAAPAAACAAGLAWGADPLVSLGPAGGTAASGTVDSNGKSDACLDQEHSGANPSAAAATDVVQVADRSCASGSGGPAAATSSPTTSRTEGAASSTTTTTSRSSTSKSATTTRRAAGLSATTATVTAAAARGLRIARVRYQLVPAKHSRRLRVVVTLRDRRQRLVRFAVVSLGRLDGARNTLRRTRLGFSNRKGQASFLVGLTRSMVGRRLLLRIGARAPQASARAVGSLVVTERVTRRGTIRHVTYG